MFQAAIARILLNYHPWHAMAAAKANHPKSPFEQNIAEPHLRSSIRKRILQPPSDDKGSTKAMMRTWRQKLGNCFEWLLMGIAMSICKLLYMFPHVKWQWDIFSSRIGRVFLLGYSRLKTIGRVAIDHYLRRKPTKSHDPWFIEGLTFHNFVNVYIMHMDFHMRLLLRKYNDTWILHFPPGILEKHLSWCLGSIFNLVAGTISSWRLDSQILPCFTCPRFTTQSLGVPLK